MSNPELELAEDVRDMVQSSFEDRCGEVMIVEVREEREVMGTGEKCCNMESTLYTGMGWVA
jgi:hypothetical protein